MSEGRNGFWVDERVSCCGAALKRGSGYAGWVARVGSACFLFVQMLMLLDFVTNWNDAWVDKEDDR